MKYSLSSLLFASTFVASPSFAVVQEWEILKGIKYRQSADNTAPEPEGWFFEVELELDVGDATSIVMSGGGIQGSLALENDNGEWCLEREFDSQAELDALFPSNTTYTITVSGGALGDLTQMVAIGAPDYPNVPYFEESDFTSFHSLDPSRSVIMNWGAAGPNADFVFLEVEETGTEVTLVDEEMPGSRTSRTVSAAALKPSACYEGEMEFANEVEISGEGGLGAAGFVFHSRILEFDMNTVFSRTVDEIVGAWQFGDGAPNESGVLVFQASGAYFHAEDIPDGQPSEQDGMEKGTYTWNPETGVLDITVLVDTNGKIGLSDFTGGFSATVDGEEMMFNDGEGTFPLKRVSMNTSRLQGGWSICNNMGNRQGVVVFLDNGVYFHAEENDGDPSGQHGMERGTYTWDENTGAFSATPIVDTNLEIGLSHPIGAFEVSMDSPRVFTISDSEATSLHRVTNASILPGWRVNKSRTYMQTADNTVPAEAEFWNLFALVEGRNESDIGAVTLRGGGLSGSVPFDDEGEGEWTYDKDFVSQALLDVDFPDGETVVVTVKGGEMGTVEQFLNMGTKAYPEIPVLSGSVFSDIQSFDPTQALEVEWAAPADAGVQLVITSEKEEDGDEYFVDGPTGPRASSTVPAGTFDPGDVGYGYLEFGTTATDVSDGGFGVAGFSGRQSGIQDFLFRAASGGGGDDFNQAASDAGLTGEDAAPEATPFNDGVPNLLKFAFNMDLGAAAGGSLEFGSGTSGLPTFELETTGDVTVLKVQYIRRKGSGLTYDPVRSTTLAPGSFTALTGTETVESIDDEFERVTVSEPCDPAVLPRCFALVEVTEGN